MPTIIICNGSAFNKLEEKGIMYLSKEKYLDLTIDPTSINTTFKTYGWRGETNDVKNVKVGTLNTMFDGRCLTIDTQHKVRQQEGMEIFASTV